MTSHRLSLLGTLSLSAASLAVVVLAPQSLRASMMELESPWIGAASAGADGLGTGLPAAPSPYRPEKPGFEDGAMGSGAEFDTGGGATSVVGLPPRLAQLGPPGSSGRLFPMDVLLPDSPCSYMLRPS